MPLAMPKLALRGILTLILEGLSIIVLALAFPTIDMAEWSLLLAKAGLMFLFNLAEDLYEVYLWCTDSHPLLPVPVGMSMV